MNKLQFVARCKLCGQSAGGPAMAPNANGAITVTAGKLGELAHEIKHLSSCKRFRAES